MALRYQAAFENVTITDAAQDILFLATSSSVAAKIIGIRLSAGVTTDVRARIQIVRRTTAGSGGSSDTAGEVDALNSRAAATTVTTARTTPGTVGDVLHGEQWSLLVPFDYTPVPEGRIELPVSGFLGVHLVAGTGASRVISGSVLFEE